MLNMEIFPQAKISMDRHNVDYGHVLVYINSVEQSKWIYT
ncbi:hypothetical protein MACH08_41220 [Oceanobacillus kimchii]|uniref:Uncharacterized protein n=1 Tax=Oceanobacillus kimchii TaxID=746691 RepID=A0ABQ5TRD5_9BACI|nr:hypothetical protein MACH08_41220 [Oceanobacillus kimchii]